MTPSQVKNLLDSGVLQAYAEGKPVQYYDPGFKKWVDANEDHTPVTISNKWRVKPEKKTIWINIYSKGEWVYAHPTKKNADAAADANRIACVEVFYEEGEGL